MAIMNDDSIRVELEPGVPITVSGKPLYTMALHALATMEFCSNQVAITYITRPFLNSALRLAAQGLGEEQGLIRMAHADEMKKPGGCSTYLTRIAADPSVNVFLEKPVTRAAPAPAGRPS
jgi:hypothetical protein